MKRVWNKETQNEDGEYYRDARWLLGIEVEDDFSQDNFTETEPESIYSDWNEELETWIANDEKIEHDEGLAELEETDMGMIRVVEDLVFLLVSNSTISFESLPAAVQSKLLARAEARDKI